LHYTEILRVSEDIQTIRLCLFLLKNRVREVPFKVIQFCITFSTFIFKLSQLEFYDLGCSEEKNKMGFVLVSLSWRHPMNNFKLLVYVIMCHKM